MLSRGPSSSSTMRTLGRVAGAAGGVGATSSMVSGLAREAVPPGRLWQSEGLPAGGGAKGDQGLAVEGEIVAAAAMASGDNAPVTSLSRFAPGLFNSFLCGFRFRVSPKGFATGHGCQRQLSITRLAPGRTRRAYGGKPPGAAWQPASVDLLDRAGAGRCGIGRSAADQGGCHGAGGGHGPARHRAGGIEVRFGRDDRPAAGARQ